MPVTKTPNWLASMPYKGEATNSHVTDDHVTTIRSVVFKCFADVILGLIKNIRCGFIN